MAAPRRIKEELDGAAHLVGACRRAELETDLPPGLLLAIASRESRCRDVVGDGGHGRGAFQIDDRRHGDWLARFAEPLPPLDEAALFVAGLLAANAELGRAEGVPDEDLLRFSLSAYDAGVKAALEALRRGDRPADGDYGVDVLRRLERVQEWLEGQLSADERPVLLPGARGPSVIELKRRLRAWYVENGQRAPRRMRGPVFGTRAVDAVKEFQRAHGLATDGIVGPKTWRALAAVGDRRGHRQSSAA